MYANLFQDAREMDTELPYDEVIRAVCSIVSNADYYWIFHP